MGKTDHTRRAVSRIQPHIEHIHLGRIAQRFCECLLELLLSANDDADAAADQIADPFILPVMEVVEGPFEYFTLRGVAAIVQDDDNRCLLKQRPGGTISPLVGLTFVDLRRITTA